MNTRLHTTRDTLTSITRPAWTGLVAIAALGFPLTGVAETRALTTAEMKQHFATHKSIEIYVSPHKHVLKVKSWYADSECATCKSRSNSASVKYKAAQNQICFTPSSQYFPLSDCFNLVQTGSTTFELRAVNNNTVVAYNTSGPVPMAAAGGATPPVANPMAEPAPGTPLGQKIVFSIEKSGVDNGRLFALGEEAMAKRGWTKEKCDANCRRGSLVKDGVKYWIEMKAQSPYVEVGFPAGMPDGKSGWLDNIKSDMLVLLNR